MTLRDLFPNLTAAEDRLIECCSEADRVNLGDGVRPVAPSPDNTVRAEVIRAILLSKNNTLPERGLRLRGAWIKGVLDLQGAVIPRDITLTACHLEAPVTLLNAQTRGLHFSDVRLAGLVADNALISGSFYLRGGSRVDGEVSLAGARIEGDMQLCGAEIMSDAQDAVFAPSLRVGGSLFIGNYPYSEGLTALASRGSLFFASARIEHDAFVSNTDMALNTDLSVSGVFGATEEHGHTMALSFGRTRIGGLLYMDDNRISGGIVNLAGAVVGRLKDDPDAAFPIRLDGFRYGDFSRHTDTDIEARLAWLDRKPVDTVFTAQPYEQLATVLTRMGHRDDARMVLMRKERLQRRASRQIVQERDGQGWRWALMSVSDFFLRITVGYGYRPGRSLIWAVALIGVLGLFFDQTWDAGDMTPNAAPILTSAEWMQAVESHPDHPAAFWSSVGQAGQDWETFHPFAYAADLVIPLVSLGQEDAWAPSTSRSEWGQHAWWVRWFAKGIGWVITALAAAAITGVIRKE